MSAKADWENLKTFRRICSIGLMDYTHTHKHIFGQELYAFTYLRRDIRLCIIEIWRTTAASA